MSVSNPGQSLKCVKVTTLGPRTYTEENYREISLPARHYCRFDKESKNLSNPVLTYSVLSLSADLKCPIRSLTDYKNNRQYCHHSYDQSIVTVTTLENLVLERVLVAVDESIE